MTAVKPATGIPARCCQLIMLDVGRGRKVKGNIALAGRHGLLVFTAREDT